MAIKKCCRTCGHCISSQGGTASWCRLRKIKVHTEIVRFVFCHHWVQLSPSLPIVELKDSALDKQLDFGRVLST